MPIDVTCGACGRAIKSPDKLAGKKVKCPQCAAIVAVPAPRSADTPPARPGPARPRPAQPKPAQPKGATAESRPAAPRPAPGSTAPSRPPGRQPSPPRPPASAPQVFQNSPPPPQSSDFMGVGDLIQEELTRDYQKRMANAEAEFERQQQEAIRYALDAPRRAAEELRSKGIHGQYNSARPLDIGFVFSRTWELYCQNFGMLLLTGIVGIVLFGILYAISFGVAFVASVAIGLGVASFVTDADSLAMANFVVGSVLFLIWSGGNLLANSYVLPGQIRYTLNLAKDQPAEFLDVLKGGPFIVATLSASVVMFFIWLMPFLPEIFLEVVFLLLTTAGIDKLPGALSIPFVVLTRITCLILFVMSVRMLLQRSLFSYVIVDLRSSGADGVEISSSLLSGGMGPMFLVYLAVFGIMLAGVATCGIGLLFGVPYCQLLMSVAFADITGAIPRVDNDD